jgi:hypothetical protein
VETRSLMLLRALLPNLPGSRLRPRRWIEN